MTNLAQPEAKTGSLWAIPQLGPETAACEKFNSSDGTAQFMRIWHSHKAGPVIVYFHGIEGHSRWFESTALVLRDLGITTYAADRRGAGASGGASGDVDCYKRLVQDSKELLEEIASRHPGTPVIFVANCWGAKVAVTVAAEDTTGLIRGLVVTSPAVATQVDVTLLTKLKIGLNYLAGGRGYFDIPLAPEHFTDNPPYLSYVRDDQLRLKRATARFFIESLKLTRACRQAAPKLTMPILVLQSGRDAIVRLEGIRQWFDNIGATDKTLKIFTTAAHSLDFEADQTEYLSLLSEWILAKASV